MISLKKTKGQDMEEEKTESKNHKHSFFQIFSMVLIGILLIAIIVQNAVIINLKIKTDKLKDKLDNLPSTSSVQIVESFSNQSFEK